MCLCVRVCAYVCVLAQITFLSAAASAVVCCVSSDLYFIILKSLTLTPLLRTKNQNLPLGDYLNGFHNNRRLACCYLTTARAFERTVFSTKNSRQKICYCDIYHSPMTYYTSIV